MGMEMNGTKSQRQAGGSSRWRVQFLSTDQEAPHRPPEEEDAVSPRSQQSTVWIGVGDWQLHNETGRKGGEGGGGGRRRVSNDAPLPDAASLSLDAPPLLFFSSATAPRTATPLTSTSCCEQLSTGAGEVLSVPRTSMMDSGLILGAET